jgi:hypothetical protein
MRSDLFLGLKIKGDFMKFVLSFFLLLITMTAQAQWYRFPQDVKLPSQQVFQVDYTAVAPVTASTTRILNANQAATSAAAVTVTSFTAQPDVSRNLVVTPAGTTADIPTGDVVITGTDIRGHVISETFSFTANDTLAQTGSKAFKTVTSILFPGEDSPYGAKWSVGIGDKLGLSRCMDGTGWVDRGLVDEVALTGITAAANSTVVSNNTYIPNPAANSSRKFRVFYNQNYRCH